MTESAVFAHLTALADPIRCRLLLALEGQELAVNELRLALQLPQSTVSRHLKVLSDEGWITSRSSGTTNWYRMANGQLAKSARSLWEVVRDQCAESPAAKRDAHRVRSALAARRGRSREFFATSADQWEQVRGDLFGTGIEWLTLGALLEPSWIVGDLGTGTGALAAAIAPFVRSVVAVDESAAMLDAARARVHGLRVDCRQGTLETLPIESGSLDLALIVLVLHHLPEPGRAIEEAGRVLKPDGRLVIVDMMPHERSEYRETMGHQWLGFDEVSLAGWCQHAGLGMLSYRSLPPMPETQGPLLFVAAARKTHSPGSTT